MVSIHCPSCARSDYAAEVLSVPEHLHYKVVAVPPGPLHEFYYSCGKCPRCGKRWGVHVVKNAAA